MPKHPSDDDSALNNATQAFEPPTGGSEGGETAVFRDSSTTSSLDVKSDFSVEFNQSESAGVSPTIDSDAQPLRHSSGEQRASDRIPKRIGGYTIEKVLGRGGMGIVYKAKQDKLNREVALKMVLAGIHASDETLQRFIFEAKAVAHLQHPNIVQIFEISEHDRLPFFSLEFVDGQSLDKKLGGKPISADEAAQLAVAICRAMEYAHQNGILHRDLKPANILLTSTGVPKITDFGLAKKLEESDDSSSTRTGTIMGTPSYMSPEQARGAIRELKPTTDQYSIGALLYEFLTGRPPFLSPKPVETVMLVLNSEPIAPCQLQPKLPVDIETICLKALQKDATKRYGSCGEMAEDLERFLRREPILARPVRPIERAWRWCQRNPVVASLIAAIGLSLLAIASISSWSAYQFALKNVALEKSQEETKKQARIAEENAAKAIENEKDAREQESNARNQESIASRRAQSIVETVQKFYTEVNGIDSSAIPKMKETRDRLMKMLLPVVEQEVLKEMPKDDKAILTAAALRKSVADSMVSQNMKDSAEPIYLQLEALFRDRAERKKSDAAKSNLVQILTSLGDLKRELARDMNSSLAYFEKRLALADEIAHHSSGDEKGEGKYSELQRTQIWARANHDLGITFYRMGRIAKAKEYLQIALASYEQLSNLVANDPMVLKLPEGNRAALVRGINDATSVSELAFSFVIFRLGDAASAEPVIRRLTTSARKSYENDVTNASALRDYCGKLSIQGEFLAQTGNREEAIENLVEAARLGEILVTLAPDNSDFMRTAALALYRVSQWHLPPDPLFNSSADKALSFRKLAHKLDPKNARFTLDLMLSEAQVGERQKALQIADELVANSLADCEMLIEIARCYSLVSSRIEEETQKEELVGKALTCIERAIAGGYEDATHLMMEVDLSNLRNHPSFETLVQSIRK